MKIILKYYSYGNYKEFVGVYKGIINEDDEELKSHLFEGFNINIEVFQKRGSRTNRLELLHSRIRHIFWDYYNCNIVKPDLIIAENIDDLFYKMI